LLHHLTGYDRAVFGLINGRWHNTFLDGVLPMLRESLLWVPLYLGMAVFLLLNYKRTGLIHLLAAITIAGLANIISSDLIKGNIFRLRPCNDPTLADTIRVLVSYRPQSSSFTSSHAVNHFALATYLVVVLRTQVGKWVYALWFWAFSIIYAQVYVGVHYPLDVLAGAAIGFLIGYLPGKWMSKHHVLH
jgi:membrane-associated phospholipid phosphatase